MSVLGSVLLLTQLAWAENWPNWRGPGFNGVAAGKGYPIDWSPSENIAWTRELPGKGTSTPIVWGNHIYLTASTGEKNSLIALDRSGQKQWETTIGSERVGKHKKASGSNPSPVTDGSLVYAYFKSGDLACCDTTGKIVWQANLQKQFGEDTLWWDLGTSPVLTKQHVVVAVMQTGPSYLAAFDRQTGKAAWKQDRNLNAPKEAAQSYSTPVVVNEGDKQSLVVLGADHVTAHDAETGKELWRVGGLNPTGHEYFRSIASAVVSDGIVIAPYARGKTITAIKLGGSGDVTKTHVLWTKEELGADVPTPAAADGKIYICTDKGKAACLDVKTGAEIWSGELEKNRNAYSASPILADGKIYLTREDGAVFILEQGPKFKVVGSAKIQERSDDMVVATPVLADGKILLRTNTALFCIGK